MRVGWLLLLAGLFLGYLVVFAPSDNAKIVVCDVGQGDAALVLHKNVQVVIDGGPGNGLMHCVGKHIPFWDTTVEMVVMSHAQADHMSGLLELFKRYQVEVVLWNELGVENQEFYEIVKLLEEKGVKVVTPKQGDQISSGEMEWRVVWPEVRLDNEEVLGVGVVNQGQTLTQMDQVVVKRLLEADVNEASVVVELWFGGFVGLFTGDIGHETEQALVDSGVLTDVVFLKVPHHGSKNSNSEVFLEAVKPEVATISVGENNGYGHPHAETLGRLDTVGAEVWRTDEVGDVVIETDGKRWWVR